MQLAVHGTKSKLEVNEATFDRAFNEALVHQVVTAYLAGGRSGTKAQKNRARASGGGAKPWRQKGTGRARAGTIRSPLWRGGGVTFAAKPRKFEQKVNKKMYRGAMSAILSELIRQDRLLVVNEFKLDEPRTKALLNKLKEFEVERGLIVVTELDENLVLAARNVAKLEAEDVISLDPVSLIAADKVLITRDAMEKLQERLQ